MKQSINQPRIFLYLLNLFPGLSAAQTCSSYLLSLWALLCRPQNHACMEGWVGDSKLIERHSKAYSAGHQLKQERCVKSWGLSKGQSEGCPSPVSRGSVRGLWEEVEQLLRWVSYILTWRSPTPWSRKPKVHSTFNHPLEKSSVCSNRQQECLFKEVHPLLFLRIFFVIFILVIFFFIVVVVFCSSCSSFSSSSLYSLSSRTLSRPLLDYPHWKRNSGLYIPWVHNYGEVEWPPYASSHILVVRCKYSSAAAIRMVLSLEILSCSSCSFVNTAHVDEKKNDGSVWATGQHYFPIWNKNGSLLKHFNCWSYTFITCTDKIDSDR